MGFEDDLVIGALIRASRRTLPAVWLHDADMDALFKRRRPSLAATRLLSNQTFRDLYRGGRLDAEQRFKITSLTILFTDLPLHGLARLDSAL